MEFNTPSRGRFIAKLNYRALATDLRKAIIHSYKHNVFV